MDTLFRLVAPWLIGDNLDELGVTASEEQMDATEALTDAMLVPDGADVVVAACSLSGTIDNVKRAEEAGARVFANARAERIEIHGGRVRRVLAGYHGQVAYGRRSRAPATPRR